MKKTYEKDIICNANYSMARGLSVAGLWTWA